jgi:hypothetical protein
VLVIDIERKDMTAVRGPRELCSPRPSFELDGSLTFQPLGSNTAFLKRRPAPQAE